MKKKPNDGPAFPTQTDEKWIHGMYLRDYFASQALQFLQVDGAYGDYLALASAAYRVADAMLAERAK